ncbi:hypothetical protein J4U01_gp097 [Mycobacterium phage Kumao]|uniref:DUF7246 domain-containing protein n=1 Tax=Mycobacterium phage Kumao TaxID=2041344 RepID=A0A2D1GQ45_9CAUD|nr:hypothetical protein J4U01_gp097 [Mycobacterium phage Kumao]ATN94061.1 hypothetical protein SEA_KUMAO_99 [Mycobacterium phage Kumao]
MPTDHQIGIASTQFTDTREGENMNVKRSKKIHFDCLKEVEVNGKLLTVDTEVSIKGERGRFRFKYARYTKDGRLNLTFVGGPFGYETFRTFYPEKIRRVHRINRTAKNIAAERKRAKEAEAA